MMKILHIALVNNNPYSGVIVSVLNQISEQNKRDGIESALLNISDYSDFNLNKHYKWDENVNFNEVISSFGKPNLVIFHEIYRKPFLKIYKLALKLKIPYIIIPHGSLTIQAQRIKIFKKIVANFLFFNKFIKNAVTIQYLSENEKNQSRMFNKKAIVIPNGMIIKEIQKEAFCENGICISFIGRLSVKIKGLDLLLNAIGMIKTFLRDNNCVFNFYGPCKKKDMEKIRRIVQYNKIDDFCFFHPPVLDNRKQEVLMSSDYFILTSRSEGIPLSVLEALSFGVPCIVTEGTGLVKIVNKYDAGWVSKTNSKDISFMIKKAIEERHLLKHKSNQGKKLVFDNYSWEKVLYDTYEIYQQLSLQMGGK